MDGLSRRRHAEFDTWSFKPFTNVFLIEGQELQSSAEVELAEGPKPTAQPI